MACTNTPQCHGEPVLDLWMVIPKQKVGRVVEYVKELLLHRPVCIKGHTVEWIDVQTMHGTIGKSSAIVVLSLASMGEPSDADASHSQQTDCMDTVLEEAVVKIYEDIHLAREVHMFLPFPAGMTWRKDVRMSTDTVTAVTSEKEDSTMSELIGMASAATVARYGCAKDELCYRVQCYPRKHNQASKQSSRQASKQASK